MTNQTAFEEESEEVEPWICIACKAEFEEWAGKCPGCSAWSSIKRPSEIAEEEEEEEREEGDDSAGALPIDEIDKEDAERIPTGISELDRVLGGGAVRGCVTLVGGDPGVGKSTLLLQALASLSGLGARTLYVTGEESADQVAARAQRIEDVIPQNLFVMAETRVKKILTEIDRIRPTIMVIDSVQTVHTETGNAGSVTQLREVTSAMIKVAKANKISTFLVGHVTKDGGLAGPKVLEHLVDTVLAFEGEKGQAFRTLRTQKNRYGSATEVGIFEMTATGMKGVPNASEFFLAERNIEVSGSIIAATSESNRSMLVEVQSLVSIVKIGGGGKIVSNCVDRSRLEMILAILEKTLEGGDGGRDNENRDVLGGRDIFVNIAGGVTITEPALDLPMALAIASSLTKIIVPPNLIAFGEVGLTGEIRGVPRVPARLSEASTMGFQGAIIPRSAGQVKSTTKTPTQRAPLSAGQARPANPAFRGTGGGAPAGRLKGEKTTGKAGKETLSVLPVRTLAQALEAAGLTRKLPATPKTRKSH